MLLIRPGCEEFLEELSKYYEIVVFTAAIQDVFYFNLVC
jgi:TFIIF-interacting CTD phosphatase-like protein